jgi:hypothetical protein
MSTNAIRQADGSVINVSDLTPGGYYIVDGSGLPARVGSAAGAGGGGYIFPKNISSSFTVTPPPDPNTMPEMSMTLEMAHGMWAAKWGWDWIPATSLQDADGLNWYRLANRLQRAMLAESYLDVDAYKLVPKTWK